MEQPLEEKILDECTEEYIAPFIRVIEVEVESPLLQVSGSDSPVQDW